MARKPIKWKIEPRADFTWVTLSGEITEVSDFAPLLPQISNKVIVLDLGEIGRINSYGIRQWVNFILALNRSGSRTTLVRCSPSVVAQLNMSTDFSRGIIVRTVLAPYYCIKCNMEHTREIALDDKATARILEPYTCSVCGTSCEFDDLPDYYLSFRSILNSSQGPPKP